MAADLHLVGHWTDAAACRGLPLAMFFPDDGANPNAAKKVCADCPVAEACGEFALVTEIRSGQAPYGVYGGVTAYERRRLIVERRRQDAAA